MREKKTRVTPAGGRNPLAVIDIGASAIRLLVAQPLREGGGVRPLESLQQAVSLGKDVFTTGEIGLEAAEACVKALRVFRKCLDEYGFEGEEHIRAVATSAVREARNRDVFLDRLSIATGLHVEVLDEAEVNRYTFMSVYPLLKEHGLLKKHETLIVEVGGGSTELLLVSKNNVPYSQSSRLGSLRLRETLGKNTPGGGPALYRLMERQIHQDLQPLRHDLHLKEGARMLLLGGEARFFASRIVPEWDQRSLLTLDVTALGRLSHDMVQRSVDEIARAYHLTFSEAEALPAALLIYTGLARELGMKKVSVAGATLRDGVMFGMTARSSRVEELGLQIIHSAIELGRKYDYDELHAERSADLCSHLFAFMRREVALSSHHEILLRVAAMLHETGRFVGERAHHKHSQYLILNSEIFGLSARDRAIVALVARYHRRAWPSVKHAEYAALGAADRLTVSKLAALLRVADGLLRTRPHKPENIELEMKQDRLLIKIARCSDLTLERIALAEKGGLFERIFGRKIILKRRK